MAIIIYFHRDIFDILKAIVFGIIKRERYLSEVKLVQYIVIATIPTALIGFFFRDFFESLFFRPKIVGFMLIVTGIILFITRFVKNYKKDLKTMNWRDSLLIGISQAMAIIPGISRSGATISTGILLGVNREFSAKFSFLLSFPSILGATLFEYNKFQAEKDYLIIIGTAVSFITGILALGLIMKCVKAGKIHNFSYYCWIMGIIIIIFG